ncbi:hypothetical protein c7_R363 [Megavirus courdo7]|uniref:Uncharacterized protein n=1 Tax=Megavirus courdo7 TaxID=1128135 RepID=H2EAK6_9VIRU|nr:hypothetical protein c7_R363 [Megavirus courdo7]
MIIECVIQYITNSIFLFKLVKVIILGFSFRIKKLIPDPHALSGSIFNSPLGETVLPVLYSNLLSQAE